MSSLWDRLLNFALVTVGWCSILALVYFLNAPEPWQHNASKQSLAEWCENRLQVLLGKDPTDGEVVSCMIANPTPKSGTAAHVEED